MARLSEQLCEIFEKAGWQIRGVSGMRIWNNINPGIQVETREVTRAQATIVKDALSAVFGSIVVTIVIEGTNFISLVIGRKPSSSNVENR